MAISRMKGDIVSRTARHETFCQELFHLLEETFDTHHGFYLDRGTSLFATLDLIGPHEASIPIGNGCATIAAQVEHVIYYLEVLAGEITGREVDNVDWGEVWSRVSGVTPAEWNDLKGRLKEAYSGLNATLRGIEDWEQNDAVGASMAILVHTAYHLGEIRQALCTVGPDGE
jgi:hypothetical protein